MKEWLIRRIKKAGENIESTLTQVVSLALFGGSVAILALSKTALNFALQLVNTPTPLWATIVLAFLSSVYIYIKTSRSHSLSPPQKPKNYKYCPECDYGIDAKNLESYCHCGTKYLAKCPECNRKIIRDRGRICSF